MFWNPAGIALAKDQSLQASFTHNHWFADLTQQAAAVSYNLEDIGTIGIGFMMFGISGIPADRDCIPAMPRSKRCRSTRRTSRPTTTGTWSCS